MGFNFTDRGVEVEIEGEKYRVDITNADTADLLTKTYKEFEKYDSEQLAEDERANYKLSCLLRDMVGALIGSDNRDKLFENRPHCVIDELELISYIYSEVQDNSETAIPSIDSILDELNVGTEGVNTPIKGAKSLITNIKTTADAVEDAIATANEEG